MSYDFESLENDGLVDLWQIDLSRVTGDNQWIYFCNSVSKDGEPFIMFNGNKYNSIPIEVEGVSRSSSGVSKRPNLTLGNIEGLYTGLISQFDSLVGADVIRLIVPVSELDKVNSPEFIAQRFLIQSTKESKLRGEIELSWITEIEKASIPSKQMFADVCAWRYRGIGCGYSGPPVADINNLVTNDPKLDQCSKSILGCQARWGLNAVLPTLMFVGIDKL